MLRLLRCAIAAIAALGAPSHPRIAGRTGCTTVWWSGCDPVVQGCARHLGVILCLLVTCRLHGIDYSIYLVDVLQRVVLTSLLCVSH